MLAACQYWDMARRKRRGKYLFTVIDSLFTQDGYISKGTSLLIEQSNICNRIKIHLSGFFSNANVFIILFGTRLGGSSIRRKTGPSPHRVPSNGIILLCSWDYSELPHLLDCHWERPQVGIDSKVCAFLVNFSYERRFIISGDFRGFTSYFV